MKIKYSVIPLDIRMKKALSDSSHNFHKWISEHCFYQAPNLWMVRHNGVELPSTKISFLDAFEQYEIDVKNNINF